MKIKNVLIVCRKKSPEAKNLAQKVAQWLNHKNIQTFCPSESPVKGLKKWTSKNFSSLHLVVVLGGDGTYLEAVRLLKGSKTPILGVNLGSLGFLTEVRQENLFEALNLTLKNKMEKRSRALLEVSIYKNGKVLLSEKALNDAVIERGASSHLIHLNIHSDNNHLVCSLKADGVIIATPTGSTAYNLAASGPILHPEVKAFVMTPICPHALTSRPLIFPDDKKIKISLNENSDPAYLVMDGLGRQKITANETVLIKRSKYDHTVLRQPKHNYFDLLRTKLKFGERA